MFALETDMAMMVSVKGSRGVVMVLVILGQDSLS